MFTVTPSAARELLAAAERSKAQGLPLRVAARRREDGALDFGIGFDDETVEDWSGEFEGLKVLVGASSRDLLDGVELDYVECEPGRFDFVFSMATGAGAQPPAGAAPQGAAPGCGGGGCSRCNG